MQVLLSLFHLRALQVPLISPRDLSGCHLLGHAEPLRQAPRVPEVEVASKAEVGHKEEVGAEVATTEIKAGITRTIRGSWTRKLRRKSFGLETEIQNYS